MLMRKTAEFLASMGLLVLTVLSSSAHCLHAQNIPAKPITHPWDNEHLSADVRADLVLQAMTLEEKLSMLHGQGMPFFVAGPSESNGGAGYTKAIPRLHIPAIQMADSAYGVTRGASAGRYSTALPSNLAAASSWDTELAFSYGALIGKELRAQGYSMSLGGGVNLAREPRNGRTFEYLGEDPLLAGTLAGNLARGVQSAHIIGDIKHYAVNDQESGRNSVNANIDIRSLRETDLRAFEIALGISDAGGVMCSYNRVNSDYACENHYLLTDVLRTDFHFKGFVLSDWGGTHSAVKASKAGLDQEQPDQYFYGDALRKAIESGEVSEAEVNEHVHRIVRTIFAVGLYDNPVQKEVPDVDFGLRQAREFAEKSIVLLKNDKHILPVGKTARIAVIGGHADVGVLSGGGSAQVDSPGGSPVPPPPPGSNPLDSFIRPAWMRDSPLQALNAALPAATISFSSGVDLAAAAQAAKDADIALVFACQWESEGFDLPTLALSEEQNKLIEAVASVNPHTVVVLEAGGPVLMPWIDRVAGVVEAWYPGIRGAEALARILAGEVNPSAKLAITFPRSDSDLPHPKIIQPPPASDLNAAVAGGDISNFMSVAAKGLPAFQITYDEGLKVGYKWFDAENKPVLFPFGFGLSYSDFVYSDLSVIHQGALNVKFAVTNTSDRSGTEIAEAYASLPDAAGEPPKRLIGWQRIELAPGETKTVVLTIPPERLTVYDVTARAWEIVSGSYTILAGGSSHSLSLQQTVALP
jgi:beta-glucosidase